MPEQIGVTQFTDWQALKRFDQNGDNVISGGQEATALIRSLGGGDAPLSQAQAEAAVAKLNIKDTNVSAALLKALTSVNAIDFDLALQDGLRVNVFGKMTLGSNWMTIAEKGSSTVVDLTDRAPADDQGTGIAVTQVTDKAVLDKTKASGTKTGHDAGAIVTEDGSFQAAVIEMGYEHDVPSIYYVQAMAAVGQREGFGLVINVKPAHLDAIKKILAETVDPAYLPQIRLVCSSRVTAWVQDSGEWRDGGKTVVAPVDVGDKGFVQTAVLSARAERDLYGHVYKDGSLDSEATVGIQGAVADDNLTHVKSAAAVALGAVVVQGRTYLEGGNVQTGIRANGQPYALVGRDSMALTKAYLEKTTKQPVSEADIVRMMAQDIGVPPENLHVIEQPGAFHLDMGLMLLGGDDMVMNDAKAAYEQQATWLKADYEAMRPPAGSPAFAAWEALGTKLDAALGTLKDRAELQAKWETQSQKDLEKAGFKVTRVAGAYRSVNVSSESLRLSSPAMNFLNVQRIRSPQGENVGIAMGGTPRAQALFQQQMLAGKPGGLDRLYFLNEMVTPETLRLNGGINCRTKLQGGTVQVPQTATGVPGGLVPSAVETVNPTVAVVGRVATTL